MEPRVDRHEWMSVLDGSYHRRQACQKVLHKAPAQPPPPRLCPHLSLGFGFWEGDAIDVARVDLSLEGHFDISNSGAGLICFSDGLGRSLILSRNRER